MSRLDKISNLPDDVLCHILSFVPTKVAIQTSVLSKRWMGLWLSVPTLNFEEDFEGDYIDHVKFVFMVYIVILMRDVLPVEKFSLKICHRSHCCYENANIWVKDVLNRGAQYLDLSLPREMDLPYATIGSRTLVVLKLACLSVNTIVINGFPSLKVLHLNEVIFGNDKCLTHLIFGCPILEEFFVDDLIIMSLSIGSTIITGRDLRSLNNLVSAVILFGKPYIPLKWICKVKSLRIYEEFIPDFHFNCTFPNLTSLVLIVDHYNWSWVIDDELRNCPNLQSFEISLMYKSHNSPDDCENWSQSKFVPECLSIHLRICTLRYYQGWKCELHFIKYIMQNARVLRIMRICSRIFSDPEEKLKVIRKFSMFPNRSAACTLHLNVE